MSPLRGSLLRAINVLQRCHPYGVEEEQVKIGVRNTIHKRRRRSNAKNFTHPGRMNALTAIRFYAILSEISLGLILTVDSDQELFLSLRLYLQKGAFRRSLQVEILPPKL